jgi:hypothetical protein
VRADRELWICHRKVDELAGIQEGYSVRPHLTPDLKRLDLVPRNLANAACLAAHKYSLVGCLEPRWFPGVGAKKRQDSDEAKESAASKPKRPRNGRAPGVRQRCQTNVESREHQEAKAESRGPPTNPTVRVSGEDSRRGRFSHSLDANDQRVSLATAAAQRCSSDSAAAPLQFVRQRQDQPRAAHPDRVAERDRAAVDVDLVLADTEVLGRG